MQNFKSLTVLLLEIWRHKLTPFQKGMSHPDTILTPWNGPKFLKNHSLSLKTSFLARGVSTPAWVHRRIPWVYLGGIPWWVWGDTVMSVGDIRRTTEYVQYTGVSIQVQLLSQWLPHIYHDIPQCTHNIPLVSWYYFLIHFKQNEEIHMFNFSRCLI